MHVIIRVRTNQYSGYESVSVYEETLDTEVPKLVRKHKMKYYIQGRGAMEKEEPHLPRKETEEHRTAVQALFPLGGDGTSVPTETGINEYHVGPRDVPTIF